MAVLEEFAITILYLIVGMTLRRLSQDEVVDYKAKAGNGIMGAARGVKGVKLGLIGAVLNAATQPKAQPNQSYTQPQQNSYNQTTAPQPAYQSHVHSQGFAQTQNQYPTQGYAQPQSYAQPQGYTRSQGHAHSHSHGHSYN
jgi:hypothetical protein